VLTDTHCHLDFPELLGELPAVIARARAAGVHRMITIGTTIEGSRRSIELAEKHPEIFAAVGIHPNAAHETRDGWIEELRAMAAHPRVVALGEGGLDYFRLPKNMSPAEIAARKATQAAVFTAQLELAAELQFPFVVHERDAWDDTVALLRPFTGKVRAVFHCFGRSFSHAESLMALGHRVSFTGIATFPSAPETQACAAQLPAGSFFVETDAPYLAPAPFRGKRCEPAYVAHTARHIAGLRGSTLEQFAAETEKAAEGFFKFRK
jgi:TatD DNase family protein